MKWQACKTDSETVSTCLEYCKKYSKNGGWCLKEHSKKKKHNTSAKPMSLFGMNSRCNKWFSLQPSI